ncbi:MAG: lipid A biosynthesis acyltransferase [Gammaproteobacteria bacterium]|nr:lipid A biosynthesis acyltransferase [Gammaproteobacteria bacterium]
MADSARFTRFSPRTWPTWLLLALLWLVSKLASYRVALGIGRQLGRIGYRVAARRRHITEVNISLCFPNLSSSEQSELVRQHFESIGIGLLMLGFSWWASDKKLQPLSHVTGLEHLDRGLQQGKGVLMLGMHFIDLDLVGRILRRYHPFAVVYRQHENPVIEYAFSHYRTKHFSQAIPRDDVRAVLRALKHNQIVWIAPDQAMRGKHTLLAPFFSVPAATTTIISRIARLSGAPVLLGFGYRLPGNQGYLFEAQPPLQEFPGESVESDTARVNLEIEKAARIAPEQYLWSHRRFKRRRGLPNPY